MTERDATRQVTTVHNTTSPKGMKSADIADVLNADPQDIRVQARTAPEKLGFPVIIIKSRTKIPRLPFLRYMSG